MAEEKRYEISEADLAARIGKNLQSLQKALGWSQARMAEVTGLSGPALSNYIRGDRCPPIKYLVDLCSWPELTGRGLLLTVDDLLQEHFDPEMMLNAIYRAEKTPVPQNTALHNDYVGVYMAYYFDQSKSYDRTEQPTRDLRYGVVVIYNEENSTTREVVYRIAARFFRGENRGEAEAMKEKLDRMFEGHQTVFARNKEVRAAFPPEEMYDGVVTFRERHAFLDIENPLYGDCAHMIVHAPQKRTGERYIGGLASVISVARGYEHAHAAQKLLLSRPTLGCETEELAQQLRMAKVDVSQGNEAALLCDFCKTLYTPGSAAGFLDEQDKVAMVERRMRRLAEQYVDKTACAVGTVSEEEDRAAYEFIGKYGAV